MKNRSIGLGRLIERGERELATAKRSHQDALKALRQACPHATAVQISRTWNEAMGDVEKPRAVAWRFCLECGESEHGTSSVLGLPKPHFRFRWLEKARIIREAAFKASAEYTAALEPYAERLHDKGLFDEFDGTGAWLGREDPIVRGED